MKGMGLTLLFIGVGIIAYAFNASDAINTAVASAIAQTVSRLGNETIWLLIGGSGAAVIGLTLLFKRPVSTKS